MPPQPQPVVHVRKQARARTRPTHRSLGVFPPDQPRVGERRVRDAEDVRPRVGAEEVGEGAWDLRGGREVKEARGLVERGHGERVGEVGGARRDGRGVRDEFVDVCGRVVGASHGGVWEMMRFLIDALQPDMGHCHIRSFGRNISVGKHEGYLIATEKKKRNIHSYRLTTDPKKRMGSVPKK